MKQLRLVPAAAVLGSLVLTAAIAFACSDKAKTTAAGTTTTAKAQTAAVIASHSGLCTAEQAAACTPEQRAACLSKGARATSAVTASTTGMSGDACCAGKSKKAVNTTALVAPVGKVNAMAVGSNGAHGAHGKAGAVAAGSSCGASTKSTATAAGSSCTGHGATGSAKATGHDCAACADFAMCEDEVKANGANVQIVPLKNGVMYVYTATGASKVTAVQAAMSRRNQHITSILASGEPTTLCGDCKTMRGAIASGKLNRETVNIEGGCMTLVTSSDPSMVSKIYSLAGLKANGRNKS